MYILEDDNILRETLRTLLIARLNPVVRCYKSGEAFLEQVDELDPGVLLLDFQMPGISGMDVLGAIDRSKFATIMLSGYGSVSLAMKVMRAGAADFLEKPFDTETLVQTIEASFEKLEQDRAAAERVGSARKRLDRLTQREKAVLERLIDGLSNKVIARELGISPRTVENHRANLMDKLEVRSLSEALRLSFAAGLVPIDQAIDGLNDQSEIG
jgi:two-component system response regulator FixJ